MGVVNPMRPYCLFASEFRGTVGAEACGAENVQNLLGTLSALPQTSALSRPLDRFEGAASWQGRGRGRGGNEQREEGE